MGRVRSRAAARTMRFIDIRRIRLSFVFYLTRIACCLQKVVEEGEWRGVSGLSVIWPAPPW